MFLIVLLLSIASPHLVEAEVGGVESVKSVESVACDKLAHMIDIDNDGELSEKEITDKESHWKLMVMEADNDNDGRISVEEFVRTVTRSGNSSSLRGRLSRHQGESH